MSEGKNVLLDTVYGTHRILFLGCDQLQLPGAGGLCALLRARRALLRVRGRLQTQVRSLPARYHQSKGLDIPTTGIIFPFQHFEFFYILQ